MNDFELRPTEKKDHYVFLYDGVNVFGENEKSFYRHMIQVFDSGINTGI